MTAAATLRRRARLHPAVALASVTGACAVGSNYVVQPLLPAVRTDLGLSTGTGALLVTLSQAGYAVGLVCLLPLGDWIDKRRMALVMTTGTAAALGVAGSTSRPAVLFGAVFAVGVLSVLAQVLSMAAAELSPVHQRGRALARVVGSMAVGIVVARTAAGALAQAGSWRVPYWVAAAVLAVQVPMLARVLQRQEAPRRRPAGQLATLLEPLRREPELRRRVCLGALSFIAYSALWTTLALHLAEAPFRYSSAQVGLFGLAGLAAVLASSLTGRLVDRGHERPVVGIGAGLQAVAWIGMWVRPGSLTAVIAGVVLLEACLRVVSVSNSVSLYSLRPATPSSVNASYMTCSFLAAATGSAVAASVYAARGWGAACALGAGSSAVACGVALLPHRLRGPGPSR